MIQQTYQQEAVPSNPPTRGHRPAQFLQASLQAGRKALYQFAYNTFIGFQLFIAGMEQDGYRPRNY